MQFHSRRRLANRATACRRSTAAVHISRGFTLTELVVSLFLLTVGVLAMARTATIITYQATISSRFERAAAIGQARLEMLRARGCAAAADGSAVHGAFTERWTVTPASGALVTAVEVLFSVRGGQRSERYTSGFAC
jgi:prepilin-type N-terminal cleavage/methylation domain-containing protein